MVFKIMQRPINEEALRTTSHVVLGFIFFQDACVTDRINIFLFKIQYLIAISQNRHAIKVSHLKHLTYRMAKKRNNLRYKFLQCWLL